MRDEPHGYGVADGLLDGTALDTELLLDCLRPHDICHERSAPGFLCGMNRRDTMQDDYGDALLGLLLMGAQGPDNVQHN